VLEIGLDARTGRADPQARAPELGARGLEQATGPMGRPPEQLTAGIRAVAGGDALLAPAVTRRLIDEFVQGGRRRTTLPPELGELTPRELQVLQLVAQGLSNAEISTALVVEETTVKTHVSRLLAKLGLRDRVQAVVLAYESGLVGAGSRSSPGQ